MFMPKNHHRMPVIIPMDNPDWWLNGSSEVLAPLPIEGFCITV
jgi:putative SOS response-associated peptidase YedK